MNSAFPNRYFGRRHRIEPQTFWVASTKKQCWRSEIRYYFASYSFVVVLTLFVYNAIAGGNARAQTRWVSKCLCSPAWASPSRTWTKWRRPPAPGGLCYWYLLAALHTVVPPTLRLALRFAGPPPFHATLRCSRPATWRVPVAPPSSPAASSTSPSSSQVSQCLTKTKSII